MEQQVKELREQLEQLQAHLITIPRQAPVIKPPKPDIYNGERDGTILDSWIFGLRQYFELTSMSEVYKVTFAVTFLRQHALTWWRMRMTSVDAGVEHTIVDFDMFVTAITEQFKPVNSTKIARDRIANLAQDRSVQEYCYESWGSLGL